MTRTQRATFVTVAVLIAVIAIAVIAAGGGGGATPAGHAATVVKVVGGKPVGGVQVLDYKKGDRVELSVKSDRAELVHVHGYNLREPIRMGGEANLTFTATIEGEFRIELERSKQQIAALRVHP